MRILLRKLSDERHALAVVRDDGRRDEVECETRSVLLHDLIHLAVEAEAGLGGGFWGSLARGRSLADMNDRMAEPTPELAQIERIVGALHPAAKGRTPAELVAGLERFAAATGETLPEWLAEGFLAAVQERLRRLLGHWRATPYGGTMEVAFPP
jgi:hypothetical protein